MTITYTIFDRSNVVSIGNTADSPEALLAVMAELNKLGKHFTYAVRNVEVK